jgi:hypothetical protein
MARRDGPKCGAKRHGSSQRCQLPAGWGTDHPGAGRCRKHFGNAPNVKKAAAREQAEDRAREVLARMDVRPVGNPLRALRKLAGQAESWKETCADLVNRLTAEEIRYPGSLKGEQLRAEIGMFQDATRLSASLLVSLVKLDLDGQLQALEDRQLDVFAAAFASAVAKAGLSPEQRQVLQSEFARGIRTLVPGDEDDEDTGALSGVVIRPARPALEWRP